jgi:hypothetical protein
VDGINIRSIYGVIIEYACGCHEADLLKMADHEVQIGGISWRRMKTGKTGV